MTSEIAVMNQRAVALAADSAVTLIDGGTVVVRNDQRKLFNLVEGRPVGADVLRRGRHDGPSLGSSDRALPEEGEAEGVRPCRATMRRASRHARQSERILPGRPAEGRLQAAARVGVSATSFISRNICATPATPRSAMPRSSKRPSRASGAITSSARMAAARRSACFPQGFGAGSRANTRTSSTNWSPTASRRSRCRGSRAEAEGHRRLLRGEGPVPGRRDGAGVRGLRQRRALSVVVTYFVSAIVGGIVKRAEASVDAIDTETRSKIRVFADSEVTNAFIRGIDYNLERRLYGGFRMMMHGLVDQVVGAFPQAEPASAKTCAGDSRANSCRNISMHSAA